MSYVGDVFLPLPLRERVGVRGVVLPRIGQFTREIPLTLALPLVGGRGQKQHAAIGH
jgi:hypothetical protein